MLAMCTVSKPSSSCGSRCAGPGAALGVRVLLRVFVCPGVCQGSGLAQCHHITQIQQPGPDANEVQLILLRDHILAFFINKLVKKCLNILSVKRVTESEIFIFLK